MTVLLLCGSAHAQFSTSAYRALGQPNLRQNGVNMVQGLEMNSPTAVATDARAGTVRLYVSDTMNHRVLAWQDIVSYQNGDAPTLVLGQPGPQNSGVMGIGAKGFRGASGTIMALAVDPANGNLYVADPGNHRILRFPNPFADTSRIEPDMVYGQTDFTGRTANWNGVSNGALNAPQGLAFDSAGNLWVADSGNHRLLRFNASVLDSSGATADLVLGQQDFSSGAADRGGRVSAAGFHSPKGLAFDGQGNLFVADTGNHRVLKFAAPVAATSTASVVLGQANATTGNASSQASASTMVQPTGVATDANGRIYVAVPGENRVLIFAASSITGAGASDVLGQTDFTSKLANPATYPYASAGTFAQASDIKIDSLGNIVIADTGNHRVLTFAQGARSASRVFGQVDFSANGANRVKPGSISTPYKIVVDYSQSPYALYVSDTSNHRVLGWRDAVRFRTGDPADIVIGQPNFGTALANVDSRGSAKPSATSLSSPKGLAVDWAGSLYVVDSGNHRVLRFPRPVSQSGRITPDLVIGQRDFTTALSAGISASTLRSPSAVALGPDGNLFISDTGNNRVLEYAGIGGHGPAAIRVYGQPDFTTGIAPAVASAQTLSAPAGIYVDSSYTLYVADSGANRVLAIPGTRDAGAAGAAAALVIGQAAFDATQPRTGAGGLRQPTDVALDSSGHIVVSDSGNHRVVVYSSLLFLPVSGATAVGVVGQKDANSSASNWDSTDSLATSRGLSTPLGIFVDRVDTLYVGDSGNSRVLHFLKPGSVAGMANPQSGAVLARGGLGTFTGLGLATGEEQPPTAELVTTLANRQLVVNDELVAPLSRVSPMDITFQLPSSAPTGMPRIAVRLADTGELIAGTTTSVAVSAPGLFTSDGSGQGQGKITNQDGTPNSPTNPAARGSVIKIFGTGQGPVSPAIADGQPAPADSPISTIAVPTTDGPTCLRQQSVCVAIGTTFGEIQFSGLAPGTVGMWQLDVKIPSGAPTGNSVALRAVINGAPSNIVSVAIR